MVACPAVQLFGQEGCKGQPVPLDNQIDVGVGRLKKQIAHKAADDIHRNAVLPAKIGCQGKQAQYGCRNLVFQDFGHVAVLDITAALHFIVHTARLCRKDAYKVRPADNAYCFFILNNGDKPLVLPDNDVGDVLKACVLWQGGKAPEHVVVDDFVGKAVGQGALRYLVVQDAHAVPCALCKDRDGLQGKVHHELVCLAQRLSLLNPYGRCRHVVGGLFLAGLLHVERIEQGIAHLAQALVLDAGRGCIDVPAAAQGLAHCAHVDGAGAGAGHNLDAVVHAPYGKEHAELLHFHQLVGQVGKVPQILLKRGFSQDYLLAVEGVGPG